MKLYMRLWQIREHDICCILLEAAVGAVTILESALPSGLGS